MSLAAILGAAAEAGRGRTDRVPLVRKGWLLLRRRRAWSDGEKQGSALLDIAAQAANPLRTLVVRPVQAYPLWDGRQAGRKTERKKTLIDRLAT